MKRQFISLFATALAASAAPWSLCAATDIAPEPDPASLLVPPIEVTAPEPRYVAPTLRDRIGRIWAPVLINGKGPYRLVLDTGATSAAIIPSVADGLGLAAHDNHKVQLHGVTGSAIVPVVKVSSLEVGDLLLEGARVPIVADVFGGAEGVLGTNGMKDKRIHIDFRHDQIRIELSRGQLRPAGYSRLPITLTRGRLLTTEIRIGSIRTQAIFDTGAQTTLGNQSLRAALLRRNREGHDQDIVGVTLDVAQGKSFRVPPIQLGDVQIRNMAVTFGDVFIFEQWKMTQTPAVLIGMDVIGTLDSLIIDYRRHELLMRTRH